MTSQGRGNVVHACVDFHVMTIDTHKMMTIDTHKNLAIANGLQHRSDQVLSAKEHIHEIQGDLLRLTQRPTCLAWPMVSNWATYQQMQPHLMTNPTPTVEVQLIQKAAVQEEVPTSSHELVRLLYAPPTQQPLIMFPFGLGSI